MKENWNLARILSRELDLNGENVPGRSLIEIAGTERVLIENHLGVTRYTREAIGIRTKSGWVEICGRGLELCHMSREQLVIRGTIAAVALHRRDEV